MGGHSFTVLGNHIIMATSTAVSPASPNVFASTPQYTRPTFLMCPPEWYGVDYVLNPWMAGNVHRSSRDLAFAQWKSMHNILRSVADVPSCTPNPAARTWSSSPTARSSTTA